MPGSPHGFVGLWPYLKHEHCQCQECSHPQLSTETARSSNDLQQLSWHPDDSKNLISCKCPSMAANMAAVYCHPRSQDHSQQFEDISRFPNDHSELQGWQPCLRNYPPEDYIRQCGDIAPLADGRRQHDARLPILVNSARRVLCPGGFLKMPEL